MPAHTIRQSLNKAFLKLKPLRADVEQFRAQLKQLLDRSARPESEEYHKNNLREFLRQTQFGEHYCNTADRIDLVIHAGKTASTPVAVLIEHKRPDNTAEFLRPDDLNRKATQELLAKLQTLGTPLGEYVNGEIYYGIKTGYNKAFVIDAATRARLIAEDARSAEVIKPFLAGRDVKRYVVPVAEQYLIFTRRGIAIDDYPAIKNYLAQFQEQLKPRPKDWDRSKKWAGRKPGPYQWYEIQDSVAYWEKFREPKIFYQEIMTYQSFTYDDTGCYGNNKLFILPNASYFLLGLLNSKLIWFILKNTATSYRGGALAMQSPFVLSLPIVETPEAKAAITDLVSQILALKQVGADTSVLEGEVDGVVFGLYGMAFKEVELIQK